MKQTTFFPLFFLSLRWRGEGVFSNQLNRIQSSIVFSHPQKRNSDCPSPLPPPSSSSTSSTFASFLPPPLRYFMTFQFRPEGLDFKVNRVTLYTFIYIYIFIYINIDITMFCGGSFLFQRKKKEGNMAQIID